MLTSTRRRDQPPAPPNKIAGFVYLFLGVFAITVSAAIFAIPQSFYGATNYKMFFGAATGAWGLFRIYTGIKTIRKASEYDKSIILNGKASDQDSQEIGHS